MAGNVFGWLTRIKDIEREYTAMRAAIDRFLRDLADGARPSPPGIRRGDASRASLRLEGTYVVRLFSEFEQALKDYLEQCKIDVPYLAKNLIDRVASRVKCMSAILDNVHLVRDTRNQLVHHGEDAGNAMTIRIATSHLCTFLSRIPDW